MSCVAKYGCRPRAERTRASCGIPIRPTLSHHRFCSQYCWWSMALRALRIVERVKRQIPSRSRQ